MRVKQVVLNRVISNFAILVRIGLGCMFLWSSLPKIRQPYDFLSDVYSYELVGPKLGMLVAMTLPWMELLVGICLVGGIFVGGALLASVGLGATFTFVIASALYRGLEISCGCFSSSAGDQISYLTLVRAIVILLLSLGAWLAVVLLGPRAEAENRPGQLVPAATP